eukprot:1398921-Pyramimonas_sp.AAC.1
MAARASAESLALEVPIVPRETDGGEGLRRYLLTQYEQGLIPASMVNTIAWHCARAGSAHHIQDLAHPPESTHHAEHLRGVLESRSTETFFSPRIPMWDRVADRRVLAKYPMNLPLDQFAESWRDKPADWNPQNFDAADIPPTLANHPVAIANPNKTCPLGYFSDGFPTTKRDGCIAHYFSNSAGAEGSVPSAPYFA